MHNGISEKLIARILAVGASLTTILIVSGSVTDPVNTPKLVAIGVTGAAALGVLLSAGFLTYFRANKFVISVVAFFVFSMFIAIFSSASPLSQNLYGSYGRNNGFFTYLFLVAILLASLSIKAVKNFETIVKALLIAGLVNISYCLWVITFGDFIGWSNPYGNILGTLGNPNFIGSFLGIFFTAYLAFAIGKSVSRLVRYSLFIVLPVTAYEIYKSNAIQGRVVAALGVGVLGFLLIRSQFGKMVQAAYLLFGAFIGIFALLGAMQIGPLTKFIYKTSVSLRGQYWLAGWNTGETHPFTGVGMDSFGDWYRRSRDAHALELPGVNTVVNAAHNVPMDMFAFGGWPLLLTYLLIMGLAASAAVRIVIRRKNFDPIFAVLLTAWAGYQLQSIISINQIGLAVWGWLLSGCLIAYEKVSRVDLVQTTPETMRAAKSKKSNGHSPVLILAGTFSGIFGLVIALPPMVSDAKWRSAQLARTVVAIEGTMAPSLYNLQNSSKYLNNIQTLEGSNLFDLSHKYALEAVEWNPEAFELWKVLYLVKNSTPEDKALALQNMKRLDPLNPDVTSIQ
ncbi:O-antigen ligase family protein [Candidatus Planktophila dulcis]|uniref:O-antigen ligase family protein n=1 Tax=Candidatus Planktophila dulcis TaxID=1884914 RepID=UPI003CE7E80C